MKTVLMALLLTLMLSSMFGTQIITPVASPYYFNPSVKVSPEYPVPWDEVNVTVRFTLGFPHHVEFGDIIRDGNIFSVYISITQYPGPVIQVVTTYTHTYHLGKMSEGSYRFDAYIDFSEESVSFVVDPVRVIDHVVVCYGYTFHVATMSNSIISAFEFTAEEKQISFNVDGPSATIGFCNITIPKELLDGEFQVLIDDVAITYTLTQNDTHSFLYFTYNHSLHTVKIIGTTIVEPPPPNVIKVPDDYLTIQEAVDAASWGDTVQVAPGTYYEHVRINKSLTLAGENRNTTVINGNDIGSVIQVTSGSELMWVGCRISGFTLSRSKWGIKLLADKNVITSNVITNNRFGITIDNSNYNTIIDNTIINNYHTGIHLWESNNNVIYHNNFINNKYWQAEALISQNNIWHDGYPSGGNYWSDYTGEDERSGPDQDRPHSDGIGDTPYGRGLDRVDKYPLMNPWTRAPFVYDIAITDIRLFNNLVVPNQSVSINVTAANQGDFPETFNVTVYYDSTAIETKNVTNLASNAKTTLTFNWNTTGISIGVYIISAEASKLPRELYTDDNTYTYRPIYIMSSNIPVVSVSPQKYTVHIGDSFTIYVNVINVTDLGAWQFALNYNTTILDAVSVSPTPYTANNTDWMPIDLVTKEWIPINDTIGQVLAGALVPTPLGGGLNGSFPLVTINFTVIALGNCTLHLYDTILGDSMGDPITHTKINPVHVTVLRLYGDVNGDGECNILDLKFVKLAYSSLIIQPTADLDNDDTVNILDVKLMKLIYSGLLP